MDYLAKLPLLTRYGLRLCGWAVATTWVSIYHAGTTPTSREHEGVLIVIRVKLQPMCFVRVPAQHRLTAHSSILLSVLPPLGFSRCSLKTLLSTIVAHFCRRGKIVNDTPRNPFAVRSASRKPKLYPLSELRRSAHLRFCARAILRRVSALKRRLG